VPHAGRWLARSWGVYLLAYNVIRLPMAQAALLADQLPRPLRFKHTVQVWISWQQRRGATDDGALLSGLMILIAQPRVGLRPGEKPRRNPGQTLRCPHEFIPRKPRRRAGRHTSGTNHGFLLSSLHPYPSSQVQISIRTLPTQTRRDAPGYRGLFADALPQDMLTALRDATNGGFVLGSQRFHKQIAMMVGRRTWSGTSSRGPGRRRCLERHD
jgi:hypothetical protein